MSLSAKAGPRYRPVAAALRDRNGYQSATGDLHRARTSSGVDAYKHTARKLAGFPVYPDRPTGAKEVRARRGPRNALPRTSIW